MFGLLSATKLPAGVRLKYCQTKLSQELPVALRFEPAVTQHPLNNHPKLQHLLPESMITASGQNALTERSSLLLTQTPPLNIFSPAIFLLPAYVNRRVIVTYSL